MTTVLPLSSRRKNTRSFSAFCDYLGAPLANRLNRWCGYNQLRGFAVFSLWADKFQGERYVLWNSANEDKDRRVGAIELSRVLRSVISEGHEAYGIRCEARDVYATKRRRGYFDEDQLLVLGLEDDGACVVAKVLGVVPSADIAAGSCGLVTPFESAVDDLGCPLQGKSSPDRGIIKSGHWYRRDKAVRDYVISRSCGRCEYCGVLGFAMVDGSHYVEAHHIIALSSQGADAVENVIALCAEHHREAHYGQQAESLEEAFLAKLKKITRR